MIQQVFSKKARYNLNLVVQETGLKPDALRAWEKRYQLPQPDRSEGGHRLYSDFDIQLIKWLQSRVKEGMRISQAADYWKELDSKGGNPFDLVSLEAPGQSPIRVEEKSNQTLLDLKAAWIRHCLDFDEQKAGQILTLAFGQFPSEIVCSNLISSSLTTIGDLWYAGEATVQQEHFASELAIRKIHTLISAAPRPIHGNLILICAPAGEHHAVPILRLNLFLRYRGWETIYLGPNVPLNQLEETVRDTQPSLAIFSASRLPAAGTMLESIRLLNNLQVPSAFGGRIFSQVNNLADLIPGHYLGSEINLSFKRIEELIVNPTLKQVFENSSIAEISDQFTRKKYLVEKEIIDYFTDENFSDILDDIKDANEFLGEEIIAGLKFGDLNLINSDLEWLKGLLQNRSVIPEVLNSYLKIYASTSGRMLGTLGRSISDWLLTQTR